MLGRHTDPVRSVLGVDAVGRKATFSRRTGVGSHPTALAEDFDGLFGRPNIHFLAAEGVGHTVEVFFKLHVAQSSVYCTG